jgi:peroxiredoxin Q/BCP
MRSAARLSGVKVIGPALLVAALAGCLHGPKLQAGDLAPDFALPGTDGKTYRLSELRARSVVVLAWFPKAFTSG